MRRFRLEVLIACVLAGALCALLLARCAPTAPRPVHQPGHTTIAADGPMTGYSRAQFGQRWKDTDRNGCDTRNDVLARDLTGVVRRGRCTVIVGTLRNPYTGRDIAFTKDHADAVQIDHVVPLADAWRSGAAGWSPARREAFANDPANLLAVDAHSNMAKGDKTPDQWLPDAGLCRYVTVYETVKGRYGLTVTPAESRAIASVESGCHRT